MAVRTARAEREPRRPNADRRPRRQSPERRRGRSPGDRPPPAEGVAPERQHTAEEWAAAMKRYVDCVPDCAWAYLGKHPTYNLYCKMCDKCFDPSHAVCDKHMKNLAYHQHTDKMIVYEGDDWVTGKWVLQAWQEPLFDTGVVNYELPPPVPTAPWLLPFYNANDANPFEYKPPPPTPWTYDMPYGEPAPSQWQQAQPFPPQIGDLNPPPPLPEFQNPASSNPFVGPPPPPLPKFPMPSPPMPSAPSTPFFDSSTTATQPPPSIPPFQPWDPSSSSDAPPPIPARRDVAPEHVYAQKGSRPVAPPIPGRTPAPPREPVRIRRQSPPPPPVEERQRSPSPSMTRSPSPCVPRDIGIRITCEDDSFIAIVDKFYKDENGVYIGEEKGATIAREAESWKLDYTGVTVATARSATAAPPLEGWIHREHPAPFKVLRCGRPLKNVGNL